MENRPAVSDACLMIYDGYHYGISVTVFVSINIISVFPLIFSVSSNISQSINLLFLKNCFLVALELPLYYFQIEPTKDDTNMQSLTTHLPVKPL